MAAKLALPSVSSFSTEGMPIGAVMFLQAVHDGLKTIDENTVYKDSINITQHNPLLQAKNAQGQAISLSGSNVASGEDHIVLVRDFELLLRSHIELSRIVNELTRQLKEQQGR